MTGWYKNRRERGGDGRSRSPGPHHQDLPGRLLAYGVRWMPGERHTWGVAMQSELTRIQQPLERWRFAIGCTGVAMFPPRRSGLIQSVLNNTMNILANHPRGAALVGFLLILPFVVLNAIVANRVEPFFSLIRPGLHTSSFEYVLLLIVLLLLPIGAFIAIRPLLRVGADGTRSFYLLNAATAALLLLVFAVLSIALGSDIYTCDVLRIPNCD